MHFVAELMNGSSVSSLSLCPQKSSALSVIMLASFSSVYIFLCASTVCLIELHAASYNFPPFPLCSKSDSEKKRRCGGCRGEAVLGILL